LSNTGRLENARRSERWSRTNSPLSTQSAAYSGAFAFDANARAANALAAYR